MFSEMSHKGITLMRGPLISDANVQERTKVRNTGHIGDTLFIYSKEFNREPVGIFHVEAAEFVLNDRLSSRSH
jgi:hypothetical protein